MMKTNRLPLDPIEPSHRLMTMIYHADREMMTRKNLDLARTHAAVIADKIEAIVDAGETVAAGHKVAVDHSNSDGTTLAARRTDLRSRKSSVAARKSSFKSSRKGSATQVRL